MPSILHKNERVDFIARKNFKVNGTQYTKGEDCSELNDHPKLEVYVRNGYVIPVVDTEADLPFQFRHTAMTRELALYKIGIGPKPSSDKTGTALRGDDSGESNEPKETESFDPGDHTIDQVMSYVETHPDEVVAVYVKEEAGKNRSTLLTKLDEFRGTPEEESDDNG